MPNKITNSVNGNVIRIEFLKPNSDARIGRSAVKIFNVTVEDRSGNIVGVERTALTRHSGVSQSRR